MISTYSLTSLTLCANCHHASPHIRNFARVHCSNIVFTRTETQANIVMHNFTVNCIWQKLKPTKSHVFVTLVWHKILLNNNSCIYKCLQLKLLCRTESTESICSKIYIVVQFPCLLFWKLMDFCLFARPPEYIHHNILLLYIFSLVPLFSSVSISVRNRLPLASWSLSVAYTLGHQMLVCFYFFCCCIV